jgi:hypothetical protein
MLCEKSHCGTMVGGNGKCCVKNHTVVPWEGVMENVV